MLLGRWFVIGSIMFVATSAVMLLNSFDRMLGEDDSVLDKGYYRWSWVLMIVCGIFCTLGQEVSLYHVYVFTALYS